MTTCDVCDGPVGWKPGTRQWQHSVVPEGEPHRAVVSRADPPPLRPAQKHRRLSAAQAKALEDSRRPFEG